MVFDRLREHCTECDRETPHDVRVDVREESPDARNAEFSREPYRVAKCVACGSETAQRMNTA